MAKGLKYRLDPKGTGLLLPKNHAAKRAYAAVSSNVLNHDWFTSGTTADQEIRAGGEKLKNLARGHERDNDYVRRFLAEWSSNVVGASGYTLESLAVNSNGEPDEMNRQIIEEGWEDWKKAKNCTIRADMHYCELKRLTERSYARDGGRIWLPARGFEGNSHKFAIRPMEIDRLDRDLDLDPGRGRGRVRGGIETDSWGRITAYHLFDEHPGQTYFMGGKKRTRVLARNCHHRFHRDRLEQTHGASVISSAIRGLRHLEKYEEAEVIAARAQASSVMEWRKDDEYEYLGDGEFDPLEDFELEPGGVLNPPKGVSAHMHQPTHPNGNYFQFRKGILMGAASGLLMNYPMLSGDLEGVSYSGLREGKLNVQALAKCFRLMNIETEERWLFETWLENALINDTLGIPINALERCKPADFFGEGFPWVDPVKEATATRRELEDGYNSLSRVCRERLGASPEKVIKQRAADLELFKKHGLTPPPWMFGAQYTPIDPSLLGDSELSGGGDEPN